MAEAVGRNIVLLSDGTGNSAGKLFKTNVWRLYEALDLSNASQIASYDDGVGTSSFKPFAVLGGAFGWGLKRNVLALYMFLCLNYKPGDRIYAFGFSRGAFTIRVLIKFILTQKLVEEWTSTDDLRQKALRLYRRFRSEQTIHYGLHSAARPLRDLLVWAKDCFTLRRRDLRAIKTVEVPAIEFLGLWDTVDAYGLPIAEIGRGVDRFIWPLSLNDKEYDSRINKACHALSIDDKRTTFHPLLWDECDAPEVDHTDLEKFTQVWFAGVHANIGGGYPDDGLSFVPLRWMIKEAVKRGLQFNRLAVAAIDVKIAPYGRIYNSRAGLGAYYRYGPRRLDPARDWQGACIAKPKIHETVVWRIAIGTDEYIPLSLPKNARIVTEARPGLPDDKEPIFTNILALDDYKAAVQDVESDLYGAPAGKDADDEKRQRAARDFKLLRDPDPLTLDLIWDTVWWRRVAYFATLITTAFLVLIPTLVDINIEHAASNPITRAAGLATGFLPGFARSWIEAFQSHPYIVSSLAGFAGLFALWGAMIDRRIQDRARGAWSDKWQANRYRWFQTSVRQRFAVAIGLWIPFFVAAAVAFLTADASSSTAIVVFLISGTVAVIFLMLSVVAAIYAVVLWFIVRRAKDDKTEYRGLGLLLALGMRSRFVAGPFHFVSNQVLPIFFALALLVVAAIALSRISFDFMDSGGWVCSGGTNAEMPKEGTTTVPFETKTGCQAADIVLNPKVKYRIEIIEAMDWKDGEATVSPRGTSTLSIGLHKFAHLLLRRKLTSPWFVVVVRIGDEGNEEYVLTTGTNEITPTRKGQLYVFVNDAVIGWSGYDRYYGDNKGAGKIRITRVGDVSQ